MRENVHEKLNSFYGDDIPGYILDAGKTFITLHTGDECFGNRDVRITMDDVADYYLNQATNITSGCRTLAEVIGDWRFVDMMAGECLEWFKAINIAGMRRAARRRGLMPKF